MLPRHGEVLNKLQEKIQYIMVDEYQDTNYVQERLIFLFSGSRNNICVVGDDDQGLYRFRGATIRNILEFPEKFTSVKCKRLNLITNYRSEKTLSAFIMNGCLPLMVETLSLTGVNIDLIKRLLHVRTANLTLLQ